MKILIILLIVALVIAIISDVIRIGQYISLRKVLNRDIQELASRRINDAYYKYQTEGATTSFGEYLINAMSKYGHKEINNDKIGK